MKTKLLRQKILDLAIRGKLTQQKKSDGTTRDLLKQIRDERTGEALQTRDASTCHCEAQKRRGNLKQSKSATPKEIIPLDKSEAPFEIPENWEWVRLGDLCSSVSSGKTPSTIQKELWDGDVLWVTSKDVKQKYIQSTQVRLSVLGAESMRLYPKNTMIIVGRSGILRHTLPVSILKQEATINQDLKALVFLNGDFVEYIYIAIKGMEQDLLHCYKKAGTTVDNLNFDEFLTAGIPIPPLAEQQRIVTAIENAFAEITEIENNQELLKKHIKQGRQKILDLAIHGKLAQQHKTDGTTKDLLKQIQDERTGEALQTRDSSTCHCEAQKRRGNLKQSKSAFSKEIIPLDKSEAPFEIPSTWEWVRLGDIARVSTGKTPLKAEKRYYEKGTIPWITSAYTKNDGIEYSDVSITEYAVQKNTLCIYAPGTLILAMYGEGKTRGQISELRISATINQACAAIELIEKSNFHKDYIRFFQNWNYARVREGATGSTQPNLNLSIVQSMEIPLPPLAEQQRIVATIEQAFAEFDAMEVNL